MDMDLVIGLIVIVFILFGIYGFLRFIVKILKKIFRRNSESQTTITTKRSEREGGITYRQEDFIFSLGDELEVDVDELSIKRYDQDLHELSKQEASDLIEHLLKKQEKL